MKNQTLATLLAFAMIAALGSSAFGQVTDQRRQNRRKLVGDLLETLIESQVNRNPQAPAPGRPNLRPAWPEKNYKPSQPLSPKMVSARKVLKQWETESASFVTVLRSQDTNAVALRPVLADALSTHAQIRALREHSARTAQLSPLTDSFCRLDESWRVLNHQLTRVRGLPQGCLTSIERISGYDTQLCELFEVQPQFNRRELARQCTAMSTSLRNLQEDIRYDLRSDPNYRATLRNCQQLYSRLNESIGLVERGTYDQVVGVYKLGVSDWRKLKYQLVSSPHGRLHRKVHQIESIGASIADLLWLEAELDREYLRIVIQSMQRDAELAFQQVNLKQILNSPNPAVLIANSRSFQAHCATLSSKLKSNVAVDDLLWDYQQLSNQWGKLNASLIEMKIPRFEHVIGEVDSGMVVLQSAFGQGPIINRATMTQICGNLEQLVYQFQNVVDTRTVSGYDPTLRADLRNSTRAMLGGVHQLHEHVIGNRRYDSDAVADLANVMKHWRKIRPMIGRCKPAEKAQLSQLRAGIEPLLVKLQVIFPG